MLHATVGYHLTLDEMFMSAEKIIEKKITRKKKKYKWQGLDNK